jgi:hypothetical protein
MNLEFLKLRDNTANPGGKARGLQNIPKNINTPNSYILDGKKLWNDFELKTQFEEIQASSCLRISEYNYDDLKSHFTSQLMALDWENSIELITENLDYPLIVRSNMSCEDSDGFSQAGLFQSFEVRDFNEFKQKSILILGQVLNKEIIINFLSHNLDFKSFFPSLLIQEFMQSEYGGIYFSRSPVTPWKKESYCEFNQGGVNTITDGTQKCINYFSKDDLKPQHSFMSGIFNHGYNLEKVRNQPLDIEWIFNKNQFTVLQVRPVNSQDIKLAFKLAPGQIFDRSVTLERFPKKLSPLGWSALQSTFKLNLEVLKTEFGITAKRPEDISIIHDGIVYTDPNFFKFQRAKYPYLENIMVST